MSGDKGHGNWWKVAVTSGILIGVSFSMLSFYTAKIECDNLAEENKKLAEKVKKIEYNVQETRTSSRNIHRPKPIPKGKVPLRKKQTTSDSDEDEV
jgi:hypothetical protein